MLPYDVLGALCLGALWLMALLVAAAAAQELQELRALGARLRPLGLGETGIGLIEGVVEKAGADAKLATHVVVQVGRALDADRQTIAFRDRSYESRVEGGVLRVGGGHIVVG